MTDDIPLYYNTEVLGVDIGDAPVETTDMPRTHIYVWPYTSRNHAVYRDLCDWVRRNGLHL